jgi:type IX secretion system PorP/SprF family membrane protein
MNEYLPQCKLRFRVTFIGLLISFWTTAQDVHFSNAAQVPLYLNPAQTGFFDGRASINLSNRLQSFSTTTDFSTTAFSYQHRFQTAKPKHYLAIGGQLQYEKTAKMDLTHLNLDGSVSYSYPVQRNGTLSVGGMLGVHQRAHSSQKLLWGDQFEYTAVNPNLPSQDLFAQNQNVFFLDISGGVQYHQKNDNNIDWHLGLGIFHLNQAKQNFGGDSKVIYPVRVAAHGGVTFPLNDKTHLITNAWVQTQDLALFHNEIGEQVTLNFALTESQTVEIGVLARQNLNAGWVTVAPQLGFKYEDWRISTAYDVNLNSACLNCRNGGFEAHITKIVPLSSTTTPVTKPRKVSPSSDVAAPRKTNPLSGVTKPRKVNPSSDVAKVTPETQPTVPTSEPATKPAEPKPVVEPIVEVQPIDDLPTEIYEPVPLINKTNIPKPSINDREEENTVAAAPVTPIVLPAFPIALYFDNDIPKIGGTMSYESAYLKYISLKDSLQQLYVKTNELPQQDRTILDFFDNEVIPNFDKIHVLYDALYRSMLVGEKLEVAVSAGTSDVATFEYNRKLAQRRFEAFYNDLRQYQNGVLIPYLDNKQLIVNQLPFKANLFPNDVESKKWNAIIGIDALQRRKVEVLNIKKL